MTFVWTFAEYVVQYAAMLSQSSLLVSKWMRRHILNKIASVVVYARPFVCFTCPAKTIVVHLAVIRATVAAKIITAVNRTRVAKLSADFFQRTNKEKLKPSFVFSFGHAPLRFLCQFFRRDRVYIPPSDYSDS